MPKLKMICCGLLWLAMNGCSKEQETPVDYTRIIATYVGKTELSSRYLQEVFTSPTMSHYEWITDSITFDPDTIRVVQLSADSFEMQTGNSFLLVSEWMRFAFRESEGPSVLKYQRSMALPGYFDKNLTLEFDLALKTFKLVSEASQNTPASESQKIFEGQAR